MLRVSICLHGDKLHSLERESGLYDNTNDAKETVEANVVRLEPCASDSTRVLPVTESDPIMVRATTKIKDDTEDDQSGNSDNLDGAGGSAISPKAGLNIMKRELTQR